MKKTLLAILLVMATIYGYSQLAAQPGKSKPVKVTLKSAAATPVNNALVPESYRNFDQGTVVYARIENGDTVYLKYITWESDEDIIYSHNPVRAVNGSRITYGDGFVSDGDMKNLRITRQRGTIEFED